MCILEDVYKGNLMFVCSLYIVYLIKLFLDELIAFRTTII